MKKKNLIKKMLVILCSLFSITIFACRDENSPSNSTSSSSSSYSTDQRMSFKEIFTANIIRGVFQRVREPANVYGFGLSPLNTNHSVDWNVQKDGRKHEERFSLFSSSSSSSRSNSFRNNSFSSSSSYSCGSSGSDTSNFAYKAYKSLSGIDLGLTSFSSSCTSSFSSSHPMRGGLAGEMHGYIMPNQHTNQGFLSKPKQLCPKVKNNYDANGKITNVQGDGRYTIDGKVSTSVENSCYKLNDLKKKGISPAMCYQSRQNTYELLNSEFPHIPTFGFAAPFGHNVRSKSFLVGVGDSLGSLSRSKSSFPSISLGRFPKVDISKIVDKSYLLLRSPSPLLGLTNLTSCFVSSSFPIRYNMVGDGLDDYDDLPLLTNDSYNDHLDNGSYNGLDLNIRPGLPILAGLPLNLSVELLKSDVSVSRQHNKPLSSNSSMVSSGTKNNKTHLSSISKISIPSSSSRKISKSNTYNFVDESLYCKLLSSSLDLGAHLPLLGCGLPLDFLLDVPPNLTNLTSSSPSSFSKGSSRSNTPTKRSRLNIVLDGIKSLLGSSTNSTSSSSSSSSMSSSGANTSINGQTSPPRYGPILDYIRRRFHSDSSSNSTSSSSSSYSSSSPSSNISNRIYGQLGESFFSRLRKEVPWSPLLALQPSSTSFFPLSSSNSSLILNCNTSLFDNPFAPFLPFPLMPSISSPSSLSIYDHMYRSLLRKMRDDINYRCFPKGNGTWQNIKYSSQNSCWEKAPQKTPSISASSSTSFFLSETPQGRSAAWYAAACGTAENQSANICILKLVRIKVKASPTDVRIEGVLKLDGEVPSELKKEFPSLVKGTPVVESGWLKPNDDKNKKIPTNIPQGMYPVIIGRLHNERNAPLLQGVVGRTWIYLHNAAIKNQTKHTQGCPLISWEAELESVRLVKYCREHGIPIYVTVINEEGITEQLDYIQNSSNALCRNSNSVNAPLHGSTPRATDNAQGTGTNTGNTGGQQNDSGGSPLSGGSYSLDPKDNDNKKVNRQDNRQNNNAPMTLKVPYFHDNRYDTRYYEWDPEENRYVYNPDKCKDNKDDYDDLINTSDEPESLMTSTSNEAAKWDIVIPHVIIDPSPVDDKTTKNQDNKHDTNPPNITSKSLAASVLDDANKSNKVTLSVNKKININIGYDIYRKDVAQGSDTKRLNIKNVFPGSSCPTGDNTTDDRLDIKNGQTPPFRGDAKPDREIVVR